eukprot:m.581905 g.581905  ORF g.581905 m.581905 type:complete len:449 (-) comp22334_c1_seq10:2826-4172(-)
MAAVPAYGDALDRARDTLNPNFPNGIEPTSESYMELQAQLSRNAKSNPIKYGPHKAFHNHAAAMLTCMYKLGGGPADIHSILDTQPEFRKLNQASSCESEAVEITRDNWKTHLGGCGLFGLGAHVMFKSYHRFFVSEIELQGSDGTLQSYFPCLAKGCVGDFFHALIELGYYFESRNVDVLAVALAWIAASYVTLPENPSDPTLLQVSSAATPMDALEMLSRDTHHFPKFDLHDGSSGYITAMETLIEDHSAPVLKYSLPIDNTDGLLMREMCDAAIASFAASGHTDFYLLHLVTGTRATWAILNGCDWGTSRGRVERHLFGVVWRSMLFTHVARNRPWLPAPAPPCPLPPPPPPPLTADDDAELPPRSVRPWKALTAIGRSCQNSHIAKVIMTCADFYDRWRDTRYWHVAEGVAAARDAGVALVGTGVGSQMARFTESSGPGSTTAP